MYWTTLEISAPRCALMCYPSSNITYCIACLLCIGVILLNKFNSIQYYIDIVVPSSDHCRIEIVPPSSGHCGTTEIAPPSDHLHTKRTY